MAPGGGAAADGLVRMMARAIPCLPSATATSGNAPSPRVTITSYRSPIPISSASAPAGCTGYPSAATICSRWPPRATRNAVSPPALISRIRARWPGRACRVPAARGVRPLIT